jgi:peroxiredoxin (alkyl hydroperoxide reductase subunit C)
MASDKNGDVSRLFDVYDEEAGKAMRGSFIINPEGRLLAKEVNYGDVGRNVDELMRKFKAYLYLSRHPVKACPSKWKDEGDATLEPGAKLVGNVYKTDGSLVQ